jgi:transcriptional regulator with XRE-family HTH domain
MDIGEMIFQMRKEMKLDQTAFGKLIECEQITISNYENNKRRPPDFIMERIAELAKVPVVVLYMRATNEHDFPEGKKHLFEQLFKPLEVFISSVFKTE